MLIYNRLTGALLFDTGDDRRAVRRNLMFADLRQRQLAHFQFSASNLRGADFENAIMSHAGLSEADLRTANMDGVLADYMTAIDLKFSRGSARGASFQHAKMPRADFTGVDFTGADLRGWVINHAKLDGAIGLEPWRIVPAGEFIGYKRLRDNRIATLMIPEEAQRVNGIGTRLGICRASEVVVMEITSPDGTESFSTGLSLYNRAFRYDVNQTVKADLPFNSDETLECAPGIHFFLAREAAERYS